MKSFTQLLLLALAATLTLAQRGPASSCADDQLQVCCNKSVAPDDPSIADQLDQAEVDPGTLTGTVGVACEFSSPDEQCNPPNAPLCCSGEQPPNLILGEKLAINCTPADNSS